MELGDILVGSTLPLHPSLTGNRRLSVGVTVNGRLIGETPFVLGDPESGIWEMGESLKISKLGKDISLAIVGNTKSGKKKNLLAELDMSDLLTRVKGRPDLKYHEISTCLSCSPIQIIVTCSVKVSSLSGYNTPGGTISSRGSSS
ncbi:hypothetical protein M408DRAFT_307062 [Serendipita vermifera MAFF 305830]|uniref:Uncharacterized protein n=1 Tax=Serendipita vermifera MAFF 305830 TaxID=933852 RepID=A0A0C3AN07_SERVB|nr:hypothetical protein M408DRAFT_307062 [Serendipita vermifera MAFF 305830]